MLIIMKNSALFSYFLSLTFIEVYVFIFFPQKALYCPLFWHLFHESNLQKIKYPSVRSPPAFIPKILLAFRLYRWDLCLLHFLRFWPVENRCFGCSFHWGFCCCSEGNHFQLSLSVFDKNEKY